MKGKVDLSAKVGKLLDMVSKESPAYVDEAAEDFVRLVDPVEGALTDIAFYDFLAYDYVDPDGNAFLERFAHGDQELQALRDSAFFSSFWVVDQNPATGMSTLVDTVDQRSFEVEDGQIATNERWASGILSIRIGCVGGSWVAPGYFIAHDNAPYRIGTPYEHIFGHPPVPSGMALVAVAEKLLGVRGCYRESVQPTVYVQQMTN